MKYHQRKTWDCDIYQGSKS